MTSRVPLRHSVVTRLVVALVLVLVLAVAATAWLAVRTATRTIREEQGRTLAQEQRLDDLLVGYAATHHDWSGVQPLLRRQASRLNRQIVLTTPARSQIAASGRSSIPLDQAPFATIDPLDLSGASSADTIDPRVVGPYRLTSTEAATARKAADVVRGCLVKIGLPGRVEQTASGRPVVVTPVGNDPKDLVDMCRSQYRHLTFPTEQRALDALVQPVARCLGKPRAAANMQVIADWVDVAPSFALVDSSRGFRSPERVTTCLGQARQSQLAAYTAPAALLFVSDPATGAGDPTGFTLSRANVVRIAVVALGVLLVMLLIAVLLGRRIVSPLRVLTDAAVEGGPIPESGRDEIGVLATALRQANARREAVEEQRRAMVADVAHELRNPLTNVRGWLEAAQDGLATTDAALISLLHEETEMLQHVVEDLADLAAADAGTLRIHPERVSLRPCLEQVIEAHTGAARFAGVDLHLDADPKLEMDADPVRLRQVVGNLVSNAIRHTPEGGTIRVAAERTTRGTTLRIADTGSGIAESDLPHVFDRFWRADASRTRASGGSGLGLPIARQLVEAHGGSLSLMSRPGRGTTVTIEVPAQ